MNQIKRAVNFLGVSRLVVIGFLLVLMVSVFPLGINPGMIYSDCLVRIGMNGFLVLAMMVSIVCGAGLNFGLPIGILCGLLVAAKKELFNLRFQNATNQLDNTSRIKEVRKNIARIQTLIAQKANA